MNYLLWNKKLWDYFFLEDFKNNDKNIVLAVTTEVITIIGAKNQIENPVADFIKAINNGPSEKDANNIDKFLLTGKKTDFLTKAKTFLTDPYYFTNYLGRSSKIKRWASENCNECLITAYLAYLVIMISSEESDDETHYWSRINQNLDIPTTGSSQGFVPDLFSFLKDWATKKGFKFYFKNIYTRKKNVGTIYSQLPLTLFEEQQIIASLYLIKKEDESYFNQLNDHCSIGLIEEFFEGQKTFLNQPTVKELNDDSSVLADVIKNYFFQNFNRYLQKINNLKDQDNLFEKILEGRKSEVLKFEPKYFIGIRNGKISGVVSINLKTNNLLKKGTLTFKNGKTEYSHDTRNCININGDDGHSYILYLSDTIFDPGKYKIFNSDLNTNFEITVGKDKTIDNIIKSPIWYKAFSKQEPDKLKIINTEEKIDFDINNPHKIITKEEINEKGFNLIGKEYKLPIGEDNSLRMIYTFSPENISNDDLKFKNRKIEITNSEVEITIKGAPDGIQGRTSFLKNAPIKISFNPNVINKIELINADNSLVKSYQEFIVKESIEETNLELIDKLEVGDYSLKVYDLADNQIINKSFTISDQIDRDNREINEIEYSVCEYDPLKHDSDSIYSNQIEEDCVYTFSSNLMEKLVDILIQGRKIGDIYNSDFKYIFKSLVEENDPEFFKNSNCQKVDLLEISKKVIYLLDSLSIIERENHQIVKLIKPYWSKSSIHRRYNLLGALKQKEIMQLEHITSVKSHSQFFSRTVNGIKIGFKLPRIFYVEKCEENVIPKLNEWKLNNPNKKYDFKIIERPVQELLCEESLILKVIDGNVNYSVPVTNCAFFNWFSLKFEDTTLDKLIQLFEYSGYKLIRVVEKKRYNNRQIFHYYLLEVNSNGITYQYYPYHERDQSILMFLKKVKYLDLSTLMLKSDHNGKEKLYNHIIEQHSTSPIHKEIIENRNENRIKEIINWLDVFHLGAYNLSFNSIIRSRFFYDESTNCFGINEQVLLPAMVDKYLISLSGLLPIYKHLTVEESPNDNLDEISIGIYLKSKTVNFKIYFNVPEKIAFKIANSLIESTVVEVAGVTAKPYNKINF
jgi:hypothetical protein